jgi:hypothetical protein
MGFKDVIHKYILYNHYGFFIRRLRMMGEEKNVVDFFQEKIILNDMCHVFSLSREEAERHYCEWCESLLNSDIKNPISYGIPN